MGNRHHGALVQAHRDRQQRDQLKGESRYEEWNYNLEILQVEELPLRLKLAGSARWQSAGRLSAE
jgi:hypothetical protein